MRVTRQYTIELNTDEAEHLDTALYLAMQNSPGASTEVVQLCAKLRKLLDTDGS